MRAERQDACAHECYPIEGSSKIHWAESGGNGRTVLDDERDKRQAERTRRGPSKHVSQNEDVSRLTTEVKQGV